MPWEQQISTADILVHDLPDPGRSTQISPCLRDSRYVLETADMSIENSRYVKCPGNSRYVKCLGNSKYANALKITDMQMPWKQQTCKFLQINRYENALERAEMAPLGAVRGRVSREREDLPQRRQHLDAWCRVSGSGIRVSGFGFQFWSLGFRK